MRGYADCAGSFITLGANVAADGVIGTIDLGDPANRIYGSIDLICFAIVASGVTTGADIVFERLLPGLTGEGTWVSAGTEGVIGNISFLGADSAVTKTVEDPNIYLNARKFRVTLANRVDGTYSVYWMPQERMDVKRAGF